MITSAEATPVTESTDAFLPQGTYGLPLPSLRGNASVHYSSSSIEAAAALLPVSSSFSVMERARADLHGCIVFDCDLGVLYVSKALRQVLDLGAPSARGQNVFELLAPLADFRDVQTPGPLRHWVKTCLASSSDEETTSLRLDFSPDRILEARIHRLSESHFVLSIEELSASRDSQRDMFAVLYHDKLTGAANRALFEHKLDLALGRLNNGSDENVTVLFLDLDRFKAVNDTLGHAAGDTLLALVSERLRTGLRESDTLARLGGDEFAILLHDGIDEQRITELASRLIDLVRRPYLVGGQVVNVGASIGAARAPEDGRTRDQVLRSADLALYHSKSAGRGVFHFFAPAMEERAQERRSMELDLRKALVLRQFELHYQPQIDVENRTVIGVEALMRWRHPVRGVLMPADFLPFAEEIGLAIPIGNWVLRTACKDAVSLPDNMVVAVNVSPTQFQSPDMSVSVATALKAAGIPGTRLEIEVTEAILLRDGSNVRSNLEALRKLGVRVAMDSFGTGLTSLSQVVNFPFDKIKIDRSLIGDTSNNPRSRAVLRAISALGQSLGIATLAGGVETPEQLAQVRAEGCNSVQGYYYSKAVPLQELAALLQVVAHKS